MADSMDGAVLAHKKDHYGGVLVRSSLLPETAEGFAEALSASMAAWRADGVRGVWLRLPAAQLAYAPIAVSEGFTMHSACEEHLQMTAWLPDTPSSIPTQPVFKVGMAGFVTHGDDVLVIKEARGLSAALSSEFWKLPGGMVEVDEELLAGAEREVLEETGIAAVALGIAGIRHAAGSKAPRRPADLYGIAYMPLDAADPRPDPVRQESEIKDVKWMPISEFLNLPHIQGVYKDLYTLAATYHAAHAAGTGAPLAPRPYGGLIESHEGPIGFRPGTHTLLRALL